MKNSTADNSPIDDGDASLERVSRNAFTAAEAEPVRKLVKELIKELGGQTAAARALGVSQPRLSTIEAGGTIGIDVARKLAAYRGMSLHLLLAKGERMKLRRIPQWLEKVLDRHPGKEWNEFAIYAVAACKPAQYAAEEQVVQWLDSLTVAFATASAAVLPQK